MVRPLPQSIVGRTCLSYYADDPRRRFPTARQYFANLFGLDLAVWTVAFQEQDQVTSACATSALWSAFHVTSPLFQHRLPSPVQITKAATTGFPLRSRALPNTDGLDIEQMAHAINDVGLEPLYLDPKNPFVLKSAVMAYLSCGIPVLLLLELKGQAGTIGFHAVTVTGFRSQQVAPQSSQYPTTPQLSSDWIDKLYVHDDQVGPFARMEFRECVDGSCLSTSWGASSGYADVEARPLGLLIPLYHKVRIPHELVYSSILHFDDGLFSIRSIVDSLALHRQAWDIKLVMVNELKKSVASRGILSGATRRKILSMECPRFLWSASATVNSNPLLEVLFDATDIASGQYVHTILVFDEQLSAILGAFKEDAHLRNTDAGRALNRVLSRARQVMNAF